MTQLHDTTHALLACAVSSHFLLFVPRPFSPISFLPTLLTYLFSSHPSHSSHPSPFSPFFSFFFFPQKLNFSHPFHCSPPTLLTFSLGVSSLRPGMQGGGARGSTQGIQGLGPAGATPIPSGGGVRGGGVNSQSSTPLGAGQSRPLTLSPPKSNNNSMRNNDHTLPSPRGLSSPSSLGPSGSPRMTQSSTAALAHDPTSTGGGGGMALTGNHRVTPQVPTHPRIHPLMHPVLSPHICPLIHTSYILRAHPRISQSPDNHRLISS